MVDNPWFKKLSNRQLNFCLEYMSGKSARASMIAVGYSKQYAEKCCHSILKTRCIINFIRFEQERRLKYKHLEYVNFQKECAERALAEPDPELRRDYMKEIRQWEKQNEELDFKLKELNFKMTELEKKSEETKPDHNININIQKAEPEHEDRA